MRLAVWEREAICKAVREIDPGARVLLFGSRAQDDKKVGDIDLMIFSDHMGSPERRRLRMALHDALGEQKIDIVLACEAPAALVRIAQVEGCFLQ